MNRMPSQSSQRSGWNRLGSNGSPASPATYIDRPVTEQSPFYAHDDLNNLAPLADNSFDVLPPLVEGATWIARHRQSDPSYASPLTLALRPGWRATLYVMTTWAGATPPAWATAAAFADTGERGLWRDNSLNLVGYQLYQRTLEAGEQVMISAGQVDYVVIVRAEELSMTTPTITPSSIPSTPTTSPVVPSPTQPLLQDRKLYLALLIR